MEAFATATEYRAKYPNTELEDAQIMVWLEDASSLMQAEMDASGIDYSNPSEDYADTLMRVCRDMAHRAIGAEADIPYGASQFSESTGSISDSFTLANPYGDLFMTKAERRRLGVTGGIGRMLHPQVGGAI